MAEKYIFTNFKIGLGTKAFNYFNTLEQAVKSCDNYEEPVQIYKINADKFKQIRKDFDNKYKHTNKCDYDFVDMEFYNAIMDNAEFVKEC